MSAIYHIVCVNRIIYDLEDEHALNVTMAQRSELDYLIYNDPLSYADLILNGNLEK